MGIKLLVPFGTSHRGLGDADCSSTPFVRSIQYHYPNKYAALLPLASTSAVQYHGIARHFTIHLEVGTVSFAHQHAGRVGYGNQRPISIRIIRRNPFIPGRRREPLH